jgi:hypothetical protein
MPVYAGEPRLSRQGMIRGRCPNVRSFLPSGGTPSSAHPADAAFLRDPDELAALCQEVAKGAGLAIVADEAIGTADVRPLVRLLGEFWSDFDHLLTQRAAAD